VAAILSSEPPPISTLQPLTPTALDRLAGRCLAKDPDNRWQTARDLMLELKWIAEAQPAGAPAAVGGAGLPFRSWLLAFVLGALATGGIAWMLMRGPSTAPRAVASLAIPIPQTAPLSLSPAGVVNLALSPDGRRLVYLVERSGSTQLYMREMDRFEVTPIAGAEGAGDPFFSPDGQWLGFFAQGKLKKIPITGGAPVTICDAPQSRGGSWGPNDTIVFAPRYNSGLWKVSAAASSGPAAPQALTTPDNQKGEISHRWPELLRSGNAVLYTIKTAGMTSFDEARIVVHSLVTGERRTLVEGGTGGRYAPSHPGSEGAGHLVYARANSLWAAPLDPAQLKLTGPAFRILDGIAVHTGTGVPYFAFSGDGSLVYVPDVKPVLFSLAWLDRDGTARLLTAPPKMYLGPRFSPDGKRLALQILAANDDIWVYEIERGTLTRLTFANGNSQSAVWSPDGKRLAFASERPGRPANLFWKAADGSGAEEQLTESEFQQVPGAWSSDGRLLVFTQHHPTTGFDIWLLPLEGKRAPRPLLNNPFNEFQPKFSPDGRWLAYVSDETGRSEVYLRAFPEAAGKSQVSTDGGEEPMWARSGRELFYSNGDKMMAVAVETSPALSAGRPRVLFTGRYKLSGSGTSYDVAPDGRGFVMVKQSSEQSAPLQIHVVLNWMEELRRRASSAAAR